MFSCLFCKQFTFGYTMATIRSVDTDFDALFVDCISLHKSEARSSDQVLKSIE